MPLVGRHRAPLARAPADMTAGLPARLRRDCFCSSGWLAAHDRLGDKRDASIVRWRRVRRNAASVARVGAARLLRLGAVAKGIAHVKVREGWLDILREARLEH